MHLTWMRIEDSYGYVSDSLPKQQLLWVSLILVGSLTSLKYWRGIEQVYYGQTTKFFTSYLS